MNKVNEEHKEFLEKLHGGFSTPREVIDQAVKNATDQTATQMERLIAGEANEVYFVQTDGEEVVVRIHRGNLEEFEREKWAMDRCSEIGVPVPRMLGLSKTEVNDESLALCVLERVPGMPLDRMGLSYKDPKIKHLIIQAGNILSKIHSIKVNGNGRLDANGEGGESGDRMEYVRQKEGRFKEVVKKHGGDISTVDQAIKILNDEWSILKVDPPRLIHGDYGPKHMMVKGGEISSIIDWGNAQGGSPMLDFAWWDYFFDNLPLEWLLEGYADKSVVNDPQFAKKLRVAQLRLGLSLIDYYDLVGFDGGAKRSVGRLEKILESDPN